jgi:hypothetical protein
MAAMIGFQTPLGMNSLPAGPGGAVVLRRAGGAGGEVAAGAEGAVAGAGDDGRAEAVVVSELLPELAQPQHHLCVQGVELLRPVDGDEGDLAASFEVDGHCCSSGARQRQGLRDCSSGG